MLWPARQLAAHGEGHIRHVVMGDAQQSEYGIRGVVEVTVHRRIVAVSRKRILCQIVGAETQEVSAPSDLSRRKSRGWSFDHGPQAGESRHLHLRT